MKLKNQQKNQTSKFEMNGGYFINGVAYMDCQVTGEPVRNVSTEAKSVVGSKAFMARMHKMFPDKTTTAKSGRPAGWHFMAEFVDKDGTVFHKGVEQPQLKGTLKPTKVKKKKIKRRTKEEIQKQQIQKYRKAKASS